MSATFNSLRRSLHAWLQPVLPPTWIIVLYAIAMLVWEAAAHGLTRAFDQGVDWREFNELVHRPRDMYLAIGLVLYGFYRVRAKHPWYMPEYAAWLALTSWRVGMRLPLGPVKIVPQDALVLLLAWLWTLDSSIFTPGHVVTLFTAPFVIAHLPPLGAAGATGRVYVVFMGLALAAWLTPTSLSGVPALVACYAVVMTGLSQSLRSAVAGNNCAATQFAVLLGQKEDRARARPLKLGYPYPQLAPEPPAALRDASGTSQVDGISMRDAALLSATLALWAFVIASFAPTPPDREITSLWMTIVLLMVAIAGRVAVYVVPFQPPISFLGRIVNGHWLIPGYDRVLLPAIYAGLPLTLFLLVPRGESGGVVWAAPVAIFVGWFITLGMRPTLRNWALTGNHRISTGASRADFIEI